MCFKECRPATIISAILALFLTLFLTKGQTQANAEAAKWYLSLKMNFCKSTSPGIKTDPLLRYAQKCSSVQVFDYQFHVGHNQIVLQIDKFQCNGSDWVRDHMQHLDLGTCFL